jgi:hypothetical protein
MVSLMFQFKKFVLIRNAELVADFAAWGPIIMTRSGDQVVQQKQNC